MAIPLGKIHPRPAVTHDSRSILSHVYLPKSHVPKSNFNPVLGRSFRLRAERERNKNSSSMTTIIMELEREQVEDDPKRLFDQHFSEVDGEEEEEERYESNKGHQPKPCLSSRWQEIAGGGNWSGLFNPMDPLLRTELIRYGEMAQACYDAFDYDPFSKYCGSCKYNRRSFFESVGLTNPGYEVTRYLYATSNIRIPNFFNLSKWPKMWSENANWIGYVAVSTDETSAALGRRDIVIAWRGTVTRLEWLADLSDFLKSVESEGIPCPDPDVKVESGFIDLYTDKKQSCRFCGYSAREQVLREVKRLVQQYTRKGEEVSISVTGHSLGSALAMLSAYDMAETGVNKGVDGKPLPTTIYSFSGPRVGNHRFKKRFEDVLGLKAIRVVNVHDTVPKVPGVLFNERSIPPVLRGVAEKLSPWWYYHHVGVELQLDHTVSPFLKDTGDLSCFHNLEAHLHLLDGYHGKKGSFVLTSGRDPALVNKGCDFLKDHHLVPPYWRQDANKGMVMIQGRWMQPERPRIDDHLHDAHRHLRSQGHK